MECLEELERKILNVLDRNKDLCARVEALKNEVAFLKEQNSQLELAVVKESTLNQSLSDEKNSIKGTIESLLESIHSLEAACRE